MTRWLCILALCGSAAAAAQELPPLEEAFDQGVLVIAGGQACHRFDIYIARTRAQQRRGLMFVRSMAATTGMLFVYRDPAYLSMWMKNTFIPLDMLFVRADGTVASIVRDTQPRSLRSISAEEPVLYVVELNAGTAARLAIEPGAKAFLDSEDYLVE